MEAWDRTHGTGDAIASHGTLGVVDDVGGHTFNEESRQAGQSNADAILTTAELAAGGAALGKAAAKKAAQRGAREFADDAARQVDEVAPRSGTGSYTNTHASGKRYHGKGSRARSQESGRRIARETGDPHVASDHTPSANHREAFKDEARRIAEDGGVQNPNNYNKINSPGRRYLDEDGQ